jgi:tetratricopeptide (TPR) repeat protein
LAVAAWQSAGDAANARRAFKEALEGYRQALAMLQMLPESAERDARELELRLGQYGVLLVAKGYTAAETVESAARVRALAQKTGDMTQLFLSENAMYNGALVAGNYSAADALADRLFDLAQREGSERKLVGAHRAKLLVSFYRGELLEAEKHFARLNDSTATRIPGAIVIGMSQGALNAAILGFADKARARLVQTLAFTRDSADPYDRAYVRFGEAWLSQVLRVPERAQAAAGEAIAVSDKYGIPLVGAWARVMMGWAQAQLGNPQEAVPLIRQGLDAAADAGANIGIGIFLASLAEAQALGGATDDALSTLEQALQANPEELIYRPYIFWVRGELRLKLGQDEAAEADLREAVALAQKMSAKLFELRAATSLTRMLKARGDSAQARELLAPLYNWFTDGFDTPNLKAAKALLDQLGT